MTPRYPTLVALLRYHALNFPQAIAYTYIVNGDDEIEQITYQELDRQARRIGAWLQTQSAAGERALLLFSPGIDYLAAYFGCLYAGVVAVPAYPPRLNRPAPRIQAILADSGACFALTTGSILNNISQRFAHSPDLAVPTWLDVESLPAGLEDQWQRAPITPETVAFLQYTSGSTSAPKGVIIRHSNLMHNLHQISHGFQIERVMSPYADGTAVFWLPVYHDMGLIGGMLAPMYATRTGVFMAPAAFLQQPIRWLRAISQHTGVISGAPNFAYQMCVDKITPEQCEGLDLSHWQVAFSGAEPVRPATLRSFAEKFAPYGFSEQAFYPCYGLAEGTLLVSGGQGAARPMILSIDRDALSKRQVVEVATPDYWRADLAALPANADRLDMVGCGMGLLGQDIVIVNGDTRQRCAAGEVGEIWTAGPSIAAGYWNRPELTATTFNAYLQSGEGPYMRTGDMGFFHEGQLYVSGRAKDLIIIRGRNYYPQDIEHTVELSHDALEASMGAAFSVDIEGEERLVVVHELKRSHRRANVQEVAAAVRRAIAETHELQTYAVVLLRPFSIPKTSSGKVRRFACREGYLEGTLEVAGQWHAGQAWQQVPAATPAAPPTAEIQSPAADAVQSWLVTRMAETLKIPEILINPHLPFSFYGLDSAQAVSLSGELENWLGRSLSPTLVWDYPSVAQLATHLASLGSETVEAPEVIPVAEPLPVVEVGEPAGQDVPIAIIGLGCRFPGADSPEQFWQLLRDGVDAIREVPAERWHIDNFYTSEKAVAGKMNTRWGGFLDNVDQFDPQFFGISPREASRIDPQQRLLLEVAWEALENAGQAPGGLAGSQTGVFVGISSYDYSRLQFSHPELIDAYAGTGNAHSIAANRISYLLDLRGPSVALDTACSSSLVAVHQAINSLRNGECDMALAGGVNMILAPDLTIFFSQARAMAADGRCKAFDASADGYVRSEGCGIVVLKRLDEALRDGDDVLAVLYGSAINQDGRSNGLTAPNGLAQQAVIRQALRRAGVEGPAVSYIEAHGTGTPLGDPIEIQSLRAVLEEGRRPEQTYHVGSVKTNLGHTEAAAGIAGLIKTVLALQHDTIPAHLHFQKLNPYIPLDDSPLHIPAAAQPWPRSDAPRLAGISSFGFGGTNAHVIVGDVRSSDLEAFSGTPHPAATSQTPPSTYLVPFSAGTAESLHRLMQDYAAYGLPERDLALADVGGTAATGRNHLPYRLAITAGSIEQLHEKIDRVARKGSLSVQPANRPKIAFLFSGAGSQYAGMGQSLYESSGFFRAIIDRCEALLEHELTVPLRSVLFPELFPPQAGSTADVDEITYTQPALFALEYALAQLWMAWGIRPDVVMGHSTGEYVAACVAGVFTLEEGLRLMAARGRLMGQLPAGGAMAAVHTTAERVQQALTPYGNRLAIATLNGPENMVISGEKAAVEEVLAHFEAQEVATQLLAVSQAAHSPLVAPMLDPMSAVAQSVRFRPLQLPLVTNLNGRLLEKETLDLHHWQQHLLRPVQFMSGMQTLHEAGVTAYIEIGPQPALLAMGRRCVPDSQAVWLPSLRKKRDDLQVMLESLGGLYEAGAEVNWDALYPSGSHHKVALPTTPFQRERYWFEVTIHSNGNGNGRGDGRGNRHHVTNGWDTPALSPQSTASHPASGPYRLPTVLPLYELQTEAAAFAHACEQLAHFAAEDVFGAGPHQLVLLQNEQPAGPATRYTLQATLTLQNPSSASIQVYYRERPDAPWRLALSGQAMAAPSPVPAKGENGHGQDHEHKAGRNGHTYPDAKHPTVPAPPSIAEQLRTATGEARREMAEDYLQSVAANILGLDVERLGRSQPLDMAGLDSLMAIEMKSRLEKEVQIGLPVVRLLEGPTVSQLAGHLLAELDAPQTTRPVTSSPLPADGPHPLSYNQQALWFLHELLPAGSSFNVAGAVQLQGNVQPAALRAAFAKLYARHDTLRLTFRSEQGRPVQRVRNDGPLPFSEIDATGWDTDHLNDYLSGEAYRPFDLAQGPIMRVLLLSRPDDTYILLLAMDHIIVDLWSLSVMVQELYHFYQAELEGREVTLQPLALQYTDFVHWEAELVQSEEGQRMRDYWLKQLGGQLPVLNLPTDRPRPAAQTFNGDTVSRRLPAELAGRLAEFSHSQGATPYMTLLAAFQALLHRYSGQDDLLVGTVLSGRDQPELAGLMGYFINPIALRADFSDAPSFTTFLQQVRQNVLGAVENQHYPLPLLADRLHFHRDPSRPPIFETMFIMQQAQILDGQPLSAFAPGMPDAQMDMAGMTLQSLPLPGMPAQFDLTLMVAEMAEGLGASLHFNTGLYDAATMERMLAHFEMLLARVLAAPDQPLAALPLLSPAEETQLLVTWNDTAVPYDLNRCVHEWVAEQASRTPECVAVTAGDESWTYAELQAQAEQLAGRLRALGVGPDTLVGIGMTRTPQMVAGLLGVWQAGGAYLPLDPTFPAERLALMVEDGRPAVLLCDSTTLDTFRDFDVPALLCATGGAWTLLRGTETPNPAPATPTSENLAYVIFTSGSTGRPKGVQIPHRALVNFLASMADRPGLTADDTLLAVTTLSFDIAGLELFLPLVTGARVVLAPAEVAGDALRLATLLESSQATVMQATPATWEMLLAAGWQGSPHLRRILCGGEALSANLAGRLLETGVELWNMYGPTETTIWSTTGRITEAQGPISIGRPIANTEILILDQGMQPVPVGVPGDLYIGGAGVARGYLDRPELTAERFLPHPFDPQRTIYKTGDQARYQADSSILFLGRNDHQVKVRGYRIELGDIEAALATHPAGQPNVVIVREDTPGDRRLVAYLVERLEGPTPSSEEWRDLLRQKLPEYMIPAHFVLLDSLPLTPNGKVDRRALPAPKSVRPELLAAYVAPRDERERQLAALLAEMLGLEQLGIHDNFFDLGGNSLMATRLIFRLEEELGVHVPLRHLFAEPTVAGLSRAIAAAEEEDHAPGSNGRPRPSLFGEVTMDQLLADAVLDSSITAGDTPAANWHNPEHVLLTGVTGFVGAFLLHDLLQRTTATVHCVVRAKDAATALRRLQQNMELYDLWDDSLRSRIVAVPGDLARMYLGLDPADFQRLAQTVDAIYHNGAMVNFVYTYETHKGSNVLGTQEVLRLAATERVKAVHFVSTLSVLHTGDHDDGTIYYEDTDMEENGVPFGGYAQSKWVAEKLVLTAGERGIPVAIYRPGPVSGHSKSGVTNMADMMSNLVRACLLLGAVPELDIMVDIVPVDFVSEAIVELSLRQESFGTIFHLANPHRWAYADVVSWLQEQMQAVESLPYEVWRERLITLARQLGGAEWGPFLPLLEEAESGQVYMPAFDTRNVLQGLQDSDILCAPVGPELLGRYLSYLSQQGFIPAPAGRSES